MLNQDPLNSNLLVHWIGHNVRDAGSYVISCEKTKRFTEKKKTSFVKKKTHSNKTVTLFHSRNAICKKKMQQQQEQNTHLWLTENLRLAVFLHERPFKLC